MENVLIFFGELDGDFAGDVMFNDMEVSTKAVEMIPWESSQKKSRHSAIPAKKAPTHTLTTNWVRKRR